VYFDRIEGTAYYIELIASLYAGYPDQVKNADDLHKALGLLVANTDIYRSVGAGIESYKVGAFASILLDETSDDGGVAWKTELMENGNLSPMDILEQHYADAALPAPQKLTPERKAEFDQKLEAAENKSGLPSLFRMLYNMIF
jgi:hypothetical protein